MLGNTSVTRLRRVEAGRDRYNQPIYETVETEVPQALFSPRHIVPAVEVGRQPMVSESTLYWFKQWPDIVSSDLLRVRGREYEVLGEPAEWRGNRLGGLTVSLKDSSEGVP